MKSAYRFPQRLIRWTSACVCFALVLSFLALVPFHVAASQALTTQETERDKAIKILTDPVLWRKDFPSLLAALQSWKVAGESKVFVFSNEAYGLRKFSRSDPEGMIETAELHLLMDSSMANKPRLRPAVDDALTRAWNQPFTTLTAVGQPGRDDGTIRVALTSKRTVPPELLAAGLTMATVRQQSGEAENVTTEIVDNGGSERRPVILTLYHYAGDAVVFAVSDMSPSPDMVDRAILDTAKISDAIFTNMGNKNKSKNNK
jgi:hypothetical protein